MPIFNLYSKRQKAFRGDIDDVYTYDNLPYTLKVQIIYIWSDTIGGIKDYLSSPNVQSTYRIIVNSLCREYGIFRLSTDQGFSSRISYSSRNYIEELHDYFLQVNDVEKELDVVELSFNCIDTMTRGYGYLMKQNASNRADNAINELNSRFKEHGKGFQFIENKIVRVDSELVHSEVVQPALRLLNEKKYQGPQEEFLRAYEHYRHGKNKEAINECLKSFESTMKAICKERKWSYKSNATSKDLIQICFYHGLVPSFWQQHFNSLRSILESSIPTGRNKLSGHGQGRSPTTVPDYLVAYMLHMTASTIVFLTNAEKKH